MLQGGAGNDFIDGRSDIDIVRLSGLSTAHHTIARQPDGSTIVQSTAHGRDTLVHVERLHFDDKSIALDLLFDGSREQAQRLILSLAGEDRAKEEALINEVAGYLDRVGTPGVLKILLDAGVVADLAGGSSDAALVQLLYTNIVGQRASATELQWHVDYMHQSGLNAAQVIELAASLDITGEALGLVVGGQDGQAGMALRLITAVAGEERALQDPALLGEVISYLDDIGIDALAQILINNGVLAQLAGASSDEALLTLLHANIVGGQPSDADLHSYLDYMRDHALDQGEALALVTQLDATAQRIDLVGLAQTGVVYEVWGG